MKTVMIVGSGGLIGQYIVKDLYENGYNLFCVEHSDKNAELYKNLGIPFLIADVQCVDDINKLPQSGIDSVIFLAGILPARMTVYEPQKYFYVNTIGAQNIFEYCLRIGVKQILYTQSHSDVANLWGKKTISPYDPPTINYKNDHTVYVISKLAAVSLLEYYYQNFQISYCVFRCPNIYAYHPDRYYYRDGKKTLIAYRDFIYRAINSEPIEIWGKYESRRDIVYVKDLAQMLRKAIEKNISKGYYNVANGKSVSIKEQVEDTIEIFSPPDNKSKIIYRPDIDIPEISYHYDIQNAIDELGYVPKYFHREMLIDMKKIMQNQKGM
ncbi:NAD-dependent epimerase/dehydratase family protein [Treponema putidum]|uniref:NAD(P)-dependent oxidoreductase n=1 Tax=Treponema putidum TaxID=221027 RepID=A0ABY5HW57_9SPIR|nr:NAD(P)-dependent oxidoreductase [Treponema putidum]UTY28307.1 NAD(P)-dependent oxidoreductase [Treponema putidum]